MIEPGERAEENNTATSEAIPFIDLNHRNLADNKFGVYLYLTLSLSLAASTTSNFGNLSLADVMDVVVVVSVVPTGEENDHGNISTTI